MDVREEILKYLKGKTLVKGSELSSRFGITRQALNKHLKRLIEESKVIKEGSTRGAAYRLPLPGEEPKAKSTYKKTLTLKEIEEDKVFHEMALLLNLKAKLSKNAWEIAYYSFTEMLNNAIDHSMADNCTIAASLNQYDFNFLIRDRGIGIFHSIYTKFNLDDENAAIGELLKGKTTTMEERHSGEGIFFTSKCADVMYFKSHTVKLLFDNLRRDVFIEEKKNIKGTEVFFRISRQSKRSLKDTFSMFAPEEFGYSFEKTRVLVRLYHKNYVSRSEAKRLLYGLDKFSEIILDFKGVNSIGQGFADEIFRVYRKKHPKIEISAENISPAIEVMINHVVDNRI